MALPVQILPVSMTSLPMPECWPEPGLPAAALGNSGLNNDKVEDQQFFLRAFRSFAEAAGSLERSYGLLRGEVERLRRELEASHSDLAHSLEENRGMRAHLDRILEGLPCGVLVAAAGGQITRANPEALRLLGFESAADLASLASIQAPALDLLESSRLEGTEQERNVRDRQGSLRWLAARHAPIADGASVFILRDVSERKSLEAAQEKLSREQALAEMSAVLAHEVRNPLGSLELFAGLLAESQLPAECRDWVEQVQAGLRALAATVNNILHFHSQPQPERAPLDLGELLGWSRDFFLPLARQSRVALSLQNRVSGVFLAADRHRLGQVLLNLVLNAVRAMPGGGWVELGGRTIRDGKAVVLTVADTGPGIPPEHLPRIFDPGFSTRAGSPGLGLAVCRKIVEQHGGTLAAASPAGCGATFTLTFPLTNHLTEGAME